jgi:3-phenylpropionate/cinnamic acid dioxygenase small subunit
MSTALSLESRLQGLEDEKQIRELMIEYGRRLDARDFRGYAQLFAREGEWIGGLGRATGPVAIEAMLVKGLGSVGANPQIVTSFHVLSNFQIAVTGDRASAYSRLLYVIRSADDSPVPSRGGHYDDSFIREDGSWKFLRRVVVGDIPTQDVLAARPA